MKANVWYGSTISLSSRCTEESSLFCEEIFIAAVLQWSFAFLSGGSTIVSHSVFIVFAAYKTEIFSLSSFF